MADWARVRELFEMAEDISDSKRDAWLVRQCGDDQDLLRRVAALLAADADDDPAGFEQTVDSSLLADLAGEQPGAALVGRTIGGYRVTGVLGVGGMGVVLEAVQEQPRRQVALKVLAGTLIAEEAQRRFQYEAEVLGRLRHPNIAQVFSAGRDVDPVSGQPLLWIAMELVPAAQTLDHHVREKNLNLRQRVEALAQVCDAVEHGHRQGVLHRDLKPANVLVDGDGRIVVIDFGIARATDPNLSQNTLTGQVLGTPRYMSPEQLAGRTEAIDTRSDVYALGVMLFELVTGQPPRDPGTDSLAAFTQRVLHEPPPRPSAIRRLPVDLDWICVRALATEPADRYGTVAAFAADLRRFLRSEPVEAGPPSTSYVLRRFVRRHRTLVASLAAIVLVLVVSAVVSALGWIDAARNARLARAEATTQETITTWLTDLLQSARADQSGRDVRVLELLEGGEQRLGELRDSPAEVEAGIRNTMAQTLLSLDENRRALTVLEGGIPRFRAELPPDHSAMTEALYLRAISLDAIGETEEAMAQLSEVLTLRMRNPGPDSTETAHVHHAIGANLLRLGRPDEGVAELQRAEEIFTRKLGADDQKTLRAISNRISAMHQLGQHEQVQDLLLDTLDRAERALGPKNPVTVALLTDLANSERARGALDQAENNYRRSLELNRELYGPSSVAVRSILGNLAVVQQDRGDLAGAEQAFLELVEAHATEGDDPLQGIIARNNLASIQLRLGKPEAALANYEGLLADGSIPEDHWLYATFLRGRGRCRMALGDRQGAEEDLLRSLRVFDASLGRSNQRTRTALESLVELYEDWGREEEAARYRARLKTHAPG